MALVLFLAFFLLPQLLLPSMSEPQCPQSFNCGKLGSFQYPFYDTTMDTQCGLCQLNCTEPAVPKIQLGTSDSPCEIVERLPSNGRSTTTLIINDPRFQEHLKGRSCEELTDFTILSSPSITFTLVHNITVFKCLKNTESTLQRDNFFSDYHSQENCGDYNLYYRSLNVSIPAPTNFPANCEVIHLPVYPPELLKYQNPTDLFSLVTASQFYIELRLTHDCETCHYKKRGLCSVDYEKFDCAYAKEDKTKHRLIIIITAIGSTFILTLCLVVFLTWRRNNYCKVEISFCFRRKFNWKKKTKNYCNVETFLKNQKLLAQKRYSYSDIKKMTNSFEVKLGTGGYGSVYKGTLSNGNFVAVMLLHESKGNGEEFINEVASVGRTYHVNIISLLGFCFEGDHRALIYEFMSNGSLEKFIYDRGSSINSQLGWEKLYQIAIGIARGLEYLHRGCNTRILHFDIKPHNILLDQDFCPKISDFGLAKLLTGQRSVISMSGMRGTPGYIAPELFSRNFGGVSHKSDVYSYGMMVLEMVGGRKNIEVGVDHTSEIYFPHWIYKRIELNEQELGLHDLGNEDDNERARKMIIVGLWCIQTDQSSRPTIAKVLEMLEASLESCKSLRNHFCLLRRDQLISRP